MTSRGVVLAVCFVAVSCARSGDGDVSADGGTPEVPGSDAAADATILPSRDGGPDARAEAGASDAGDAGVPDAGDAGSLPTTLTNGLVLYVNLDDGIARDSAGRHDGGAFTTMNLAAAPDRFGRPTGATRFKPSPPALVQIDPAQLPLGSAARTLSVWVKPRVSPATPTNNSNVFVHWGLDDCNAKMFGLGHLADKGFGWTGCVDVTTASAVPVGAWTFMAMTYDGANGTGTLTVWVNEVKTARAGVTLGTTGNAPMAIGGERKTIAQGFTYYIDGDLDDVRVWSRALTDAELTALAREK